MMVTNLLLGLIVVLLIYVNDKLSIIYYEAQAMRRETVKIRSYIEFLVDYKEGKK